MSELVSVEPRRAKFIEQGSAILDRIPEAAAEVILFIFMFKKYKYLILYIAASHPVPHFPPNSKSIAC